MATEPQDTAKMETVPPEGGRREVSGRQVAIALGAILVLLALFWFFFLRGGDDATEEIATPPTSPGVTTPPPEEGVGGGGGNGGDGGGKPPVKTFEVFASRDPFDPLLTADAGGETGDTGDTGDTGEEPTDTGEEPTDTDGDGDIDDDDAPPGGTDGETVEGHSVSVIAITENGASIQVDDVVYEVGEGETFAENFELLSTSGECATVLYGDDQFTVCEGEEILK
ncbi:MAG: hypothetical protein M3174_03350 [Actinomycetota bacterium]|nr:hypothetical protein [Actinomycetota bacterium]